MTIMTRKEEWAQAFGDIGVAPKMQLMQLPLHILDPWQGADGQPQPFKPYTPEKLEELAESIRQNGVIEAISVRTKPDGRMEILAGHNRVAAAKLAGLQTIPAIVQQLDDASAEILLVDSNLKHREKLLPSEKARAYKMLLEARKRQGQRMDLTSSHDETKLGQRTDEQVASEMGESRAQIQRYIRLNYLIDPLLDMVDSGKPGLVPGVDLSFLSRREQEDLLQVMQAEEKVPNGAQAKALRKASAAGALTGPDAIRAILVPETAAKPRILKIPTDRLSGFFPPNTSEETMEETILAALRVYLEQQCNK